MGTAGSRAIVFAGPTLAGAGPQPAGFDLRPPARRGDVLAAVADRPEVLVLLDGYYYTVPAVTHKELLYALDAGIRVLGAASLGALRAAEMAPFGMTGVGRIFAAYAGGALDGDDEVALLHAPAEYGYRTFTVALVEVRFALERIAAPAGESAGLVAALKAIPFTGRRPERVRDLARRFLGGEAALRLEREMARCSVKRDDALEALERAADLAGPAAPRRRTSTGYLNHFKEAHLRCPPLAEGLPGPTVLHAWVMAQLFHPEAPAFLREVRRRFLLAEAAERAGAEAGPREVEREVRSLRECHERLFGRPCLPEPEYEEEARVRLLAAAACAGRGGGEAALAALARSLGLEAGETGQAQLRLLAAQPDHLPPWAVARAFSFTSAFEPAVAAAAAAEEVQRCFRRWSGSARILREDLWRLAAELWGCDPAEVPARGAERGLTPFYTLSDGLRKGLELVAAAERLPAPVNGYPEARDRLRAAALMPRAAAPAAVLRSG